MQFHSAPRVVQFIQLSLHRRLSFKSIDDRLLDIIDKMPKQRAAAAQLLQQRVKKGERLRQSSTIANSMYFQVIGNGTRGNPASVLLRSENSAYLFNCGEGTQRLAHEHKIKFGRLGNIFVTSSDWNNLSGVLGLTLTLQDIGVPRVTLHGPEGITSLFEATKSFVPITTGMQLMTRMSSQGGHVDPDIRITYVPLTPSEHTRKNGAQVIAYVGQAPQLPGSLDPTKCMELKIPVGPHLGKLKSGFDVVLPDGRHIKSSDVAGPPKIGPKFIVLECPSLCFMESINSNPILNESLMDSNLRVVVHFTPSSVFNDGRYRQWLAKFPAGCQHLVLNESCNPINFQAIYRMQNQLNMIDHHIFPSMSLSVNHLNNGEGGSPDSSANEKDKSMPSKIFSVECGDKVCLRPNIYLETASLANDVEAHRHEALEIADFEHCLKQLKPKLQAISPSTTQYPELIFLGTGSAIPSKVRNTSCILLNMTSESSMIMDAGEGSFGQLHRFYGETKATDDVLKRLKLIYISHYHADHHLGLIEIIRQRSRLTSDRLCLIVPPQLELWLDDYCSQFENLKSHVLVYKNRSFDPYVDLGFVRDGELVPPLLQGESLYEKERRELYEKLPMVASITTTQVKHCAHAYAVVVKLNLALPNGELKYYSIAYSGDALPSDKFVEIGRDCDLLIHEATMEDDLAEEALVKRHSTTSQAIDVGRRMSAKFTLLTHFSQRYAKIPVFSDKFNQNVGVAFDNLRLSCPADLARLPLLAPTLTALFREHIDMLANARQKAELRQRLLTEHSSSLQT